MFKGKRNVGYCTTRRSEKGAAGPAGQGVTTQRSATDGGRCFEAADPREHLPLINGGPPLLRARCEGATVSSKKSARVRRSSLYTGEADRCGRAYYSIPSEIRSAVYRSSGPKLILDEHCLDRGTQIGNLRHSANSIHSCGRKQLDGRAE